MFRLLRDQLVSFASRAEHSPRMNAFGRFQTDVMYLQDLTAMPFRKPKRHQTHVRGKVRAPADLPRVPTGSREATNRKISSQITQKLLLATTLVASFNITQHKVTSRIPKIHLNVIFITSGALKSGRLSRDKRLHDALPCPSYTASPPHPRQA